MLGARESRSHPRGGGSGAGFLAGVVGQGFRGWKWQSAAYSSSILYSRCSPFTIPLTAERQHGTNGDPVFGGAQFGSSEFKIREENRSSEGMHVYKKYPSESEFVFGILCRESANVIFGSCAKGLGFTEKVRCWLIDWTKIMFNHRCRWIVTCLRHLYEIQTSVLYLPTP